MFSVVSVNLTQRGPVRCPITDAPRKSYPVMHLPWANSILWCVKFGGALPPRRKRPHCIRPHSQKRQTSLYRTPTPRQDKPHCTAPPQPLPPPEMHYGKTWTSLTMFGTYLTVTVQEQKNSPNMDNIHKSLIFTRKCVQRGAPGDLQFICSWSCAHFSKVVYSMCNFKLFKCSISLCNWRSVSKCNLQLLW